MKPSVLVIAGLDPSGGAGLLADAEAVRALGARAVCVATALTVQTTRAVKRWEPVDRALVSESIHALLLEENVRAIKIGMIADAKIADAVLKLIAPRRDLPLVVDPVLASSSGAPLFKGNARDAYFALAANGILTPNVAEAAVLLEGRQPQSPIELEEAGRKLLGRGMKGVLMKGGHLPGEPVDVLVTAAGAEHFEGPRIRGTARGTGCRLASALAAGLALGKPLKEAAAAARTFVRDYLSQR